MIGSTTYGKDDKRSVILMKGDSLTICNLGPPYSDRNNLII